MKKSPYRNIPLILVVLSFLLLDCAGMARAQRSLTPATPGWATLFGVDPQAIEATEPMDESNAPPWSTFWRAQVDWAPLPENPLGLPVWPLSESGTDWLLDDLSVDYSAVLGAMGQEEVDQSGFSPRMGGRESAAQLRPLDLGSWSGAPPQVYLTNLVVTQAINGLTVSFDVRGGPAGVPWDILRATELTNTANFAASIGSWTFLGIGYTTNRYSFVLQPSGQAFYLLARPRLTTIVAWVTTPPRSATRPWV